MKRPFLVLLAVAASAGFAVWLVRTPHELRDILLACAAWVLGFWVAAAIQSPERRRKPARRRSRARDEDEVQEEDWAEEDDEAEESGLEDGDEADEEGDWDEEWEDDR